MSRRILCLISAMMVVGLVAGCCVNRVNVAQEKNLQIKAQPVRGVVMRGLTLYRCGEKTDLSGYIQSLRDSSVLDGYIQVELLTASRVPYDRFAAFVSVNQPAEVLPPGGFFHVDVPMDIEPGSIVRVWFLQSATVTFPTVEQGTRATPG